MNASLRISNPTRLLSSKSHRQTLSGTLRHETNLQFHINTSKFSAISARSHSHHRQAVSFIKSDRNGDVSPGDFRSPVAVSSDGNRLVTAVLLGWLGAETKHLKRYAEIYSSRGMETMSFVVPVSEMLWFDLGRNTEGRIERLANDVVSWLMESDRDGRERCLVFHTFSNTGWLVYGKILRHLQGRPELMKRIKGCIVDSGGDPEINPKVWAAGFAIAILKNRSSAVVYPVGEIGETDPITSAPKLQRKEPGLIETLLLFVLEKIFSFILNLQDVNKRLSKVITGVSKKGPSCPQLYLYSTADRVILYHSVESFMEEQRRMGRKTLSLLERCSNMEELIPIHARMVKTRLDMDTLLVTKFLTICASPERGNLAYAKMVFNRFPMPNTFMWNAMIKAHSNSQTPEEALHFYTQMLRSSVAHNDYTFPFLLKACSRLQEALKETQQIHAHVFKMGFESEVFASNSLIHSYASFGDTESAFLVFKQLPQRDIVSWNSIIDGLAKNGEVDLALKLFRMMPEKNIISWTTMMSSCIRAGLNKESLDLFYEMLAYGIKPDPASLSSALTACAKLGALDQGVWIHAYIKKNGTSIDSILACALIDMYSKSGDVENAIELFSEFKRKRSVATWTAMITGFGIHGRGREALELFREMEKAGLKPNGITFTAVLTACSYAGLVNEGRVVFEKMERVYGIRPSMEHYGCMVDLLSRAGLVNEAKEVIDTMPLEPNAVIWGSLLNACRVHGNLELGKEIGKILVQVDPSNGGRYVHLASVYSADGEWDEAVNIRRNMKNQGVSKLRGCSAIVGLDGTVHKFSAG